MTTNKPKKVTKYRAHTTHGGGHRKKRRGAGSRGGRGRAGRGKKGKAKKQSFGKLGKHGFVPRGSISQRKTKKIKIINISDLDEIIKKHKIKAKEGIYLLDLASLGYQKLLGTGKTSLKLQIKVNQFSKQAEEKIKAADGSIISEKPEPKKEVSEALETKSPNEKTEE